MITLHSSTSNVEIAAAGRARRIRLGKSSDAYFRHRQASDDPEQMGKLFRSVAGRRRTTQVWRHRSGWRQPEVLQQWVATSPWRASPESAIYGDTAS